MILETSKISICVYGAELLYDADIIFITHLHYDHFSPDDIKKIKNENTKIIVTKDLFEKSIQCGFEEDQ